MTELRGFYPAIEPYESGMLDVGDGHEIYYERCGKKGGKPTVFVHGGPGGGSSPIHRSLFNPQVYDIMIFDQRGCGRSTLHAELENNTTWHLVADLEKLRELMGADKWEGFIAPIPEEERHDMIAAYRKRLVGNDEAVRLEAAKAWSIWEGETITLMPDESLTSNFSDGHFSLAFARIENHFFTHGGWLEEGQLLRDAHKLNGIPGAIIHGRYDMPGPARYAYALHKAWPEADFHLIEGAGHAFNEPGILDRLIRATDRFSK